MSSTPVQDPISCKKVSKEEAQKQMRETTEAELAKLAELMKTQKIPQRDDVMSEEENDTDDTTDSDDDSDYVPSKRKRNSTKQMQFQQNVEAKMYSDNQKLHKKIHKYGLELHRVQKELHYIQLELNNKTLECNELKIKSRQVEIYENSNKTLCKKLKFFQLCNIVNLVIVFSAFIDYKSAHAFFPLVQRFVIQCMHTILILYNQVKENNNIVYNVL